MADIANELLPPGWVAREARSKPGRIYYLNLHTRKSTWIKPTFPAKEDAVEIIPPPPEHPSAKKQNQQQQQQEETRLPKEAKHPKEVAATAISSKSSKRKADDGDAPKEPKKKNISPTNYAESSGKDATNLVKPNKKIRKSKTDTVESNDEKLDSPKAKVQATRRSGDTALAAYFRSQKKKLILEKSPPVKRSDQTVSVSQKAPPEVKIRGEKELLVRNRSDHRMAPQIKSSKSCQKDIHHSPKELMRTTKTLADVLGQDTMGSKKFRDFIIPRRGKLDPSPLQLYDESFDDKHVMKETPSDERSSSTSVTHDTGADSPAVTGAQGTTPAGTKVLKSSKIRLPFSHTASTDEPQPVMLGTAATRHTTDAACTGKSGTINDGKDEVEAMDYVRYEEIQLVRSTLKDSSTEVFGQLTALVASDVPPDSLQQSPASTTGATAKHIYIVLDTNVLIDKLRLIMEIKDRTWAASGCPYLVIPWVVMQELDALKHRHRKNNNQSTTAQVELLDLVVKAVSFLNKCLEQREPRFIWQTPREDSMKSAELPIECNDDRILQCLLQIRNKYGASHVGLFTMDRNLRNKALIMQLEAFNDTSLMEWLRSISASSTSRSPSPYAAHLPSPHSRGASPYLPQDLQMNRSSPYSRSASPYLTQDIQMNRLSPHSHSASPFQQSDFQMQRSSPHLHGSSPHLLNDIKMRCSSPLSGATSPYPQQNLNAQHLSALPGHLSQSLPRHSPHHRSSPSIQTSPSPHGTSPHNTVRNHNMPSPHMLPTTSPPPPGGQQLTESVLVDMVYSRLKEILQEFLSAVLESEMKEIYDEIWLKVVYRKPPWTLMDVLHSMLKHWIAVFGQMLPRSGKFCLEKLTAAYESGRKASVADMLPILSKSIEFCSLFPTNSKYIRNATVAMRLMKQMRVSCDTYCQGQIDLQQLHDALNNQASHSSMTRATSPTPVSSLGSHDVTAMITSSPGHTPPLDIARQPLPHTSPYDTSPVQQTPGVLNNSTLDPVLPTLQLVQHQFQAVFESFIRHKDMIARSIMETSGSLLKEQRQETLLYMKRMLPLLLNIEQAYKSLGEDSSFNNCHALVNVINTYAAETQLQPWQPMQSDDLIMFVANETSREMLKNGYSQLQEILQEFHTCWASLSPSEQLLVKP